MRPSGERHSVIPERGEELDLRVPGGKHTMLVIADTLNAVLGEPDWQRVAQPSDQHLALSHVGNINTGVNHRRHPWKSRPHPVGTHIPLPL